MTIPVTFAEFLGRRDRIGYVLSNLLVCFSLLYSVYTGVHDHDETWLLWLLGWNPAAPLREGSLAKGTHCVFLMGVGWQQGSQAGHLHCSLLSPDQIGVSAQTHWERNHRPRFNPKAQVYVVNKSQEQVLQGLFMSVPFALDYGLGMHPAHFYCQITNSITGHGTRQMVISWGHISDPSL